ncbi:ATP-binding cassette, subfamily A (ABC1), member 1, partial [Paragonimus westermani]
TSNTTDSQASEDTNEAVDQSPMSYFGRRRAQLDAIRMSVRMSRFTDDGKLPLPATRHSLINRSHIFDQTINRPPTEATSYDMVGGHQGLTYSLHVSVAQQLRAMFHKRFHHFKRYKRGWAIEFLLPVTLIILALLFVGFVTQPYSNPPMPIHPWLMTVQGHKLHVFYENHMYATGDPDLNSSELQTIRHVASNYEKAFTMPYGFTGTRCIPSSVYQILPKDMASCEHRTKPLTWNPPSQLSAVEQDVARNSSLVQCSCVEGPQQCPANAIRPNPPPTVELQTTDILYNLTAYNVTDYLLKTRDLFINKRFGGISFITSTSPLARGSLETLLNPQNPLFTLLGSLTPISPSTPDPFWSQAADTLRLMLPPTHHLQIWFDNKGYVSAPAYLNMLQNMQLRMLLTNDTSSDTLEAHRSAGIAIVNHPVELPPDVAITRSRRTLMLDVTLAIFTILALSFIPASCITFLVTERHTGSKHLQFVSGLNAYVYWISVYLWDIVNYLIPAGLCILVFVAFQKYAFVGTDTIGPFILLIFFYGLAVLPMLYPFSFVIRSPSTALIVLIVVNMLFGALTVMVTLFLDTIYQEDPELAPVVDLLKGVFLVLPQYCLGRGLYDLAFRESMLNFRHTGLIDFTAYENPLGWNVLGEKLLALGLQTVAFLTLVLLVEHRFFKGPIKRYLYKRHPLLAKRTLLKIQKKIAQLTSSEPLNAEDVQFEQRRVFELQETNSLASTSAVSTIRLTKFFGRMKMPSVNQLTFAIHPGECFGLLGVNGAGKTTTFRMLTGSLKPTFGVAYVNGYNVVDQQRQAHRSLGFCPQFDAVHHLLTGRETLTLYARLRGVPEHSIPQTVSTLLTDMGLAPHADKVAGAYSGGNRRKLSTAIAILGDPQVIFLDEPTSGMDPLAKRFLWDQIIRLIKSGKSVLLTSHSMEECEALCDRLGIMANGQFRCLGSVQQLKNKFGSGYTVELRISESPESADQVRHTLQTEFPQLTVSTTQTKCYEYQFPQRVQLARLFETLNRLRTDGLIEQYS